MENKMISVETTVNAPVEKVWKHWNTPESIMKWYFASDDWHAPRAVNDLKVGGKFMTRMESKDGSMGFDFEGTYTKVDEYKLIEYVLADARKIIVTFTVKGKGTIVTERFDPENENPIEMQKGGWQAILNNFKKFTEGD